MKKYWCTEIRTLLGMLAALAVAFITFVSAASLDPEPYHDGSQLPAAIVVSEGGAMHLDVFSAYGFVTGWLQGISVKIFGPQLITIRMFTAIALILVTVLLYLLARWVTRSVLIALGVSALWTVSWPGQSVIWGTPLLPWPSVLFLVFQLSAVLAVLSSFSYPQWSRQFFLLAGGLSGFAVLVRIQYGVALIIAMIVALLLLRKDLSFKPRSFLFAAIGLVVSIALPLGIIAFQGGFPAFIDQSIIGPLKGNAIVKATEWFYLRNAYLWGSLLLFMVVTTVWVTGRRIQQKTHSFTIMVCLLVLGLTLWESAALESSPIRSLIVAHLTWEPALDGQVMQPIFLAASITIIVALYFVLQGVRLLTKQNSRTKETAKSKKKLDRVAITILVSTSFASLLQLFPVADPNHLWWAAPLPLLLLIFIYSRGSSHHVQYGTAAVLIIPGLVLSVPTAIHLWSKPREILQYGVLKGMKVTEEYLQGYREADKFLVNMDPKSVKFVCKEGLFSVWNGQYLASGAGYVDYAYRLGSAQPDGVSNRTILCLPWGDITTALKFAKINSMTIVRLSGEIKLSYFTDIQMVELKRIKN